MGRFIQAQIRDSAICSLSVEKWPFLVAILMKTIKMDVLGSFFSLSHQQVTCFQYVIKIMPRL